MYDLNVGSSPEDAESRQEQREEIVKAAFLWVLCSMRPLRLNEVLDAVSIRDDGSRIEGVNADFLLNIGSNFIRADANDRVTFTHLSVRQYLLQPAAEKRFCLTSEQMNSRAASRCLRQLLLSPHIDLELEFFQSFNDSYRGFGSYSSTYWPSHVRASEGLVQFSSLQENFGTYLGKLKESYSLTAFHSVVDQISAYAGLTSSQHTNLQNRTFDYKLAAERYKLGLRSREAGAFIALAHCFVACGI